MTDNHDENINLTGNKKKLDDIYNSWQFVGVDENGYNTYLPLSRKSIKFSKSVVAELENSHRDEEEQDHINYVKKVLRSAMKRKMRASWKVILICLILAGLWGWQLGAFKGAGDFIIDKEGKDLADYYNSERDMLEKFIKEAIEIDIPETKAKIAAGKARIKDGIDNEKLLEEAKEELKKDEKHLVWLEKDYLPDNREKYDRIKDMGLEEYKADKIAVAENEKIKAWISMGIWLVLIILYMITSRRPYFFFWKNSYEDGTLTTIDDLGAAVVSSALISGIVNFDSNSTEYVKWSDGSVTQETNLTGGGIGIIFAVVLVMFYAAFIAITLPIRIVWNWLRNYIFYF